MKTISYFSIFLILISCSSCLTYQTVEYTIDFTDNFNSGKISVVYTDIRSSETEEEKQKADFEELLDLYENDIFLLDQIEEGIYVKDRNLYEKDGMIVGSYSGIFQNVRIDDHKMDVRNDERYIMIDLSENDKIESNGKVLRSESSALIYWPKDQKHLTIKRIIHDYDNIGYSILDYYKKWKN